MHKFISITFFTNRPPMRLHMTKRDFRAFYYWLQNKGYQWTAINIYEKKSSLFVTQLRPYNYWTKINSI